MEKHEQKNCPKCNAPVECKPGDIGNCQCYSIRLNEATTQHLAQTYYTCLCRNCLSSIDEQVLLSFPTHKSMFIEGLHYYEENGFWVFTEFYHLLRGRCCGSGCRHCVYGFQK